MPVTSHINGAVELNGKIYACNEKSVICYAPEADKWRIDAFNTDLYYGPILSMLTAGQFLYVFSPYFIHQYDPVENIWTLVS